jgi:hypothetical protein
VLALVVAPNALLPLAQTQERTANVVKQLLLGAKQDRTAKDVEQLLLDIEQDRIADRDRAL